MNDSVDVQACTCLQAMSSVRVDRLMSLADEALVPTGYAFFEEGELLSSLYLLLAGSVSLNRIWPAPIKTFVRSVGPGELFGWSALTAPYRAKAGARAMTSCQVLVFSRECLTSILPTQDGWLTMMGWGETAVTDEHIQHFPVTLWAQTLWAQTLWAQLMSVEPISEQGGELMYGI